MNKFSRKFDAVLKDLIILLVGGKFSLGNIA
ncbi:MAG: hypothetical protein ACD_67C00200G0002 [uncultured bacterium]|nr:MAG: hypothetical protein ACD_67C00200G0002 [uncultured bacterium]